MTLSIQEDLFNTILDYPSQYYLYTNNNLVRNYFSLDSITCLSCMENNDILMSLGAYFQDALIISDIPLSSKLVNKLIKSENNAYSICLGLSINTTLSADFPAFLVDNEYNIVLSNLSEYTCKKHMLAIIVGSIPFSYVNKVIFKNEEECSRFNFTFSNIHNPSDIFEVNESVFSDDNDIDLFILEEKFTEFQKEHDIDLKPSLQIVDVRNKYKGMLAGALFGQNKIVGKYKFHGDASLLEHFGYEQNVRKKLFQSVLSGFFPNGSENDKKELTDLLVNNMDNSPFIHLPLILNNIPQDFIDLRKVVDDLKFDIESERDDLLTLIVILKVLLSIRITSGFSINDIIVLIIEKLRQVIDDDDESMKTIIMGLYFIQQNILNDFSDISEVLSKENNTKIRSIRSFMVFAKSPLSSDFEKLSSSVDSFPINEYESRLIWMFYGALHGMSAFGKRFKESPHINRIADEYTVKLINSPFLVSKVPTFIDMLKYRLLGSKKVYALNGFPLDPEVQISREEKESERVRSVLINSINKNIKQHIKIINSRLLKSRAKYKGDSFTIIYSFSKDRFTKMTESDKSIKISSKTATIIEEVDLNILYDELLNSEDKFLESFRNNKDMWIDIDKKIKSKKTNG